MIYPGSFVNQEQVGAARRECASYRSCSLQFVRLDEGPLSSLNGSFVQRNGGGLVTGAVQSGVMRDRRR